MKKNNKKRLCFWLMLVTLVAGKAVFALESDAEQPITIDANTATYDDAAEVSVYTGNVVSVQGSIRVNSDKLVVHLKGGEPEKLVFTGQPARFKQTPDAGGNDIVGEALTGEYHPKSNLLVFIGHAIVKQGNGTYSSELIQYDIRSSVVKAGEKASDSKRVHVILKPKAQ